MRIGILSDTHDQVQRTIAAIRLLTAEGVEALIHCGDLTGPEVVYECVGPPCHFVFGNNDYDEDALRRAMKLVGGVCLGRGAVLTLGGRRIAVTHGDSGRELRRLTAERPDYLFTGHTHCCSDERDGPTRWINPGALHRADAYTVAVLDLERDDLRFLEVPSKSAP